MPVSYRAGRRFNGIMAPRYCLNLPAPRFQRQRGRRDAKYAHSPGQEVSMLAALRPEMKTASHRPGWRRHDKG